MNYADIKRIDVANGPGVRVSLFVSGCTHHCKGCFNEVTWDFQYGRPFTRETILEILSYLDHDYIKGLTLLGGEPMERINQQGLIPLVEKIRQELPDKTIWCFTGYDFEKDIMGRMFREWEETPKLLTYLDIIVDGKFIEEQKNINLRFRGSSNQRIIKVQESLSEGTLVLWDETKE